MRARLRPRSAYDVMAAIAFVALISGGSAYAVAKIGSGDIKKDAVRSRHLKSGQVKPTDLAPVKDWREVAAGSETDDACADGSTGVFCSKVTPGPGFVIVEPWRNLSFSHASAAFYKDPFGVVHFKGLVTNDNGSNGLDPTISHIFRLPPAYRPDRIRVFPTIGKDVVNSAEVAVGRIDVVPNGDVDFIKDCAPGLEVCSASGDLYVTLDGISFRPDE